MSFTRDAIAKDNLLIIWIDDLIDVFTWRDAFGLRIQTQNIDRLMAGGVRFANAYATVPLCAPCRAELATGISPFRSGLVDLNRYWFDVLPPTAAWQLDLRRAGFRTFQTGKVDANYQPSPPHISRLLYNTEVRAREVGKRTKSHEYFKGGPGVVGVNGPNDKGEQDKKFYDHSVASNAVDHLGSLDPTRRHLIQVGFKHPHYKLDCPDRFYQMYDPAQIVWPNTAAIEDFTGPQPGMAVYEAAYIANGPFIPEKIGGDGWRQVVRGYFAAITHVDHEIGRVLDALAASRIAGNTTVVLLSDNGFNLGTHDSFHKMSQWDSAAHVPLCIWNARMGGQGKTVETPVSLHNFPKTILDLAGVAPRPELSSGQSLLPLIDPSFGRYDTTIAPITAVFGTLSVRPAREDLSRYRFIRYPNGEDHVYDLRADPGETINLVEHQPDSVPLSALREELIAGAAHLGLDLCALRKPEDGVQTACSIDGSVVLVGGVAREQLWAYGPDADSIHPDRRRRGSALWYMGGPDKFKLQVPFNIEKVRIATVLARHEKDKDRTKMVSVVAHPQSPIHFETSERVSVRVRGSRMGDVMLGSHFGSTTFYGGAGDDQLLAISESKSARNFLYGGQGNDTLIGGLGDDDLYGGPGDDLIYGGRSGRNRIYGGHGDDTIVAGAGTGQVHTGPGQNAVTVKGTADGLFVGDGENDIDCSGAATRVIVTYGGVTRIRGWSAQAQLDITSWPAKPRLSRLDADTARLQLALSIVEVSPVPDLAAFERQLVTA